MLQLVPWWCSPRPIQVDVNRLGIYLNHSNSNPAYLDSFIVRGGKEIWLVRARIVINVVDSFRLVGLQGEVCMRGAEIPDLHGTIQAGRSKSVGILRVDGHAHHVVAMTFKDLNTLPTLLPVPQSHSHIITGSQHVGLSGVNGNRTNVVRVCFEGCDLFGGVVVVDTELEVI